MDKKINLDFSVKNILDQQPEIVSGYPTNGELYRRRKVFEF